jgi:signal transduction histidine kinase
MARIDLNFEIYLVLLAIVLIMVGLTGFIIYFITLYRKKQVLHLIEKEKLALQFQQEMLKTQLEVQEQTLQTIGADLHDNIGQLLSLTSLTLNSIDFEDAGKTQKKVEESVALTLRSIKELRQLGKLLQGDQLVAVGLSEAIRHEVEWLERSGKYQVSYDSEPGLPTGNTDKDLIVFRILQEALNNIIKHANASRINIKLTHRDAVLYLYINDNGVGFNVDSTATGKHGLGLHNIHKRATIIGGEVLVRSKPGEGTSITIIIPYT